MMFKDIEWQKRGKINRTIIQAAQYFRRKEPPSIELIHSWVACIRYPCAIYAAWAMNRRLISIGEQWTKGVCVGLYGFDASYLAVVTPPSRFDQSTSFGNMSHAYGLFSVALLCICHVAGLSQHLRRSGPITHDYS